MKIPLSLENQARSTKAPTSGCFAGILRHLICSGNFSRISGCRERGGVDVHDQCPPCKTTNTPNVVAKLMGLESMPENPSSGKNLAGSFVSAPNSLSRSRSVSAISDWSEFHTEKHHHTRTCSFRESLTFLQQENGDFVLLSLKRDDGLERERHKSNKKTLDEEAVVKREKKLQKAREEPKVLVNRESTLQRRKRIEGNQGNSQVNAMDTEDLQLEMKLQSEKNREKCRERVKPHCKESPERRIHRSIETQDSFQLRKKGKVKTHEQRNPSVSRTENKFRKREKQRIQTKVRERESSSNSENSSPVSVLDPPFDDESYSSKDTSLTEFGPEPWQIHQSSLPAQSAHQTAEPCFELDITSPNLRRHVVMESWVNICRLLRAEGENTNWVWRDMGIQTHWGREKEVEEVRVEIAGLIFDQLMEEAAIEFAV
ncbi:uncharacterized protein LOC18433420 [Amborella trichopoda]|nr:uncharacterized protein LOC18433420 [Amborella trichopoda]|eukprot:XP_020522304.1 uncharacterized protein LOC18433420 [Amborella trichopoda]